ncbi:MAG: bifunctional 3-deoxy-7-phosphoheptulonate synthase/chorismate mutase [archaeon]
MNQKTITIEKTAEKAATNQKTMTKPATLAVSRDSRSEDTIITIKGNTVGGDLPIIIGGPCAIESESQMLSAAQALKGMGVSFLRGGAFKPRTSPYSFQGLGQEGILILERVGRATGMVTVTEVMEPEQVVFVAEHADILQIGSRNMQNFALLKKVGEVSNPILLKRGFSSTIDEFMHAAEYVAAHGNPNIILCERGIRTFETRTRNTLDISAIPLLKQLTHLPVIGDPSHASGIKSLIGPLSKAILAVGGDGIMVECHPDPSVALSDADQQLNIPEMSALVDDLRPLITLSADLSSHPMEVARSA